MIDKNGIKLFDEKFYTIQHLFQCLGEFEKIVLKSTEPETEMRQDFRIDRVRDRDEARL